jgi:hypothetical protein
MSSRIIDNRKEEARRRSWFVGKVVYVHPSQRVLAEAKLLMVWIRIWRQACIFDTYRYRNFNFNSEYLLATSYSELTEVDTFKCAIGDENAPKETKWDRSGTKIELNSLVSDSPPSWNKVGLIGVAQ